MCGLGIVHVSHRYLHPGPHNLVAQSRELASVFCLFIYHRFPHHRNIMPEQQLHFAFGMHGRALGKQPCRPRSKLPLLTQASFATQVGLFWQLACIALPTTTQRARIIAPLPALAHMSTARSQSAKARVAPSTCVRMCARCAPQRLPLLLLILLPGNFPHFAPRCHHLSVLVLGLVLVLVRPCGMRTCQKKRPTRPVKETDIPAKEAY